MDARATLKPAKPSRAIQIGRPGATLILAVTRPPPTRCSGRSISALIPRHRAIWRRGERGHRETASSIPERLKFTRAVVDETSGSIRRVSIRPRGRRPRYGRGLPDAEERRDHRLRRGLGIAMKKSARSERVHPRAHGRRASPAERSLYAVRVVSRVLRRRAFRAVEDTGDRRIISAFSVTL